MVKLWNEYRKESRMFWVLSFFAFIFISGFLIYKLGFQQLHFEGISQFVLIVVFFFLFVHFAWEMYRQMKVWTKSQYRLMPITECTFYFSNILFGWISTTLFLVGYYACFVGLIFLLDKQVDLIHFQEYWKHLLVGSYFFLSASIYLQLVYLLTSLISAKVPHRYQKVSKYLLFLIVFVAEVGLSEQLLDGYRKIAFIESYQFKLLIGYVPFYLSDFMFDIFLLVLCSISSILILKKYIEAERR